MEFFVSPQKVLTISKFFSDFCKNRSPIFVDRKVVFPLANEGAEEDFKNKNFGPKNRTNADQLDICPPSFLRLLALTFWPIPFADGLGAQNFGILLIFRPREQLVTFVFLD